MVFIKRSVIITFERADLSRTELTWVSESRERKKELNEEAFPDQTDDGQCVQSYFMFNWP